MIGTIIFVKSKKKTDENRLETDNFTYIAPEGYDYYEEFAGMKEIWARDLGTYMRITEMPSLYMSLEAFCEDEKIAWEEQGNVENYTFEICENTTYPTARVRFEYGSGDDKAVLYEYIIHTIERNFMIIGNFAYDNYEEQFRDVDKVYESAQFTGTEPKYQPEYEDENFKIQLPEGFFVKMNKGTVEIHKQEMDSRYKCTTIITLSMVEEGKTCKEAADKIAKSRETETVLETDFLGKYDAYSVSFVRLPKTLPSDIYYYFINTMGKNYKIYVSCQQNNKADENELRAILDTLELK